MKKLMIFLTIISLFLLTSCGESQQQTNTGGVFIGGTQGVIATFEPFSVKVDNIYTIFDTEDFPINVILKNKGEEVVTPGKVTLRLLGPAKEDFQNIPQWQVLNKEEISKISEFNPDGGEEVVSFTPTVNAKYTALVTGFTDLTWNLEYAYDYKTHLIMNDVCFKGDFRDPKVCDVEGDKTFAVSGAPITVTKVNQDTAGKGLIVVKIDISNAGKGQSTFVGKEFDERFSQVSYSVDEAAKWECKSSGRQNEARLVDGKAQITCQLKTPVPENDVFTKSLRLTLDYKYKELIQEKLRIKESAE
ncbi:MAG: hypothetical protein Q7K45_02930 [Nanoarchaeota archaeon]|nr:hypothetical protein [Nanoarchaeota archaeon]